MPSNEFPDDFQTLRLYVALRSNLASQRVMEKTGLRYVGMTGDAPEPKVCYEIRRADWRKREGV